jgi:hypothetical protein
MGMVEWEWDQSDLLHMPIYIRTMSYHKLYRYWRVCGKGEEDPASVISHLHRCLMWATYPSVWGVQVVAHNLEDYRYLYRRYVPIIEELSASGWEPLTYATVNRPGILLERYGDFREGSLHYALQNTNREPAQVEVAVDSREQGFRASDDLQAHDLTYRIRLPVSPVVKMSSGQPPIAVRVTLGLQPGEARVFHLADGRGRYLEACRNAQRGLARLQRVIRADVSQAPALNVQADEAGAMAQTAREFDTYLRFLWENGRKSGDTNRDKMVFRIFDEFAAAALVPLGMGLELPSWPEASLGKSVEAVLTIGNEQKRPLSVVRIGLDSILPAEAMKLEVGPLPATLVEGERKQVPLRIIINEAGGRTVVPVLVSVTARRGPQEVVGRRLLDVRLVKLAT